MLFTVVPFEGAGHSSLGVLAARVAQFGQFDRIPDSTGLLFGVALVLGAPVAAALFHAPAIVTQLRLGGLYVLFFTLNSSSSARSPASAPSRRCAHRPRPGAARRRPAGARRLGLWAHRRGARPRGRRRRLVGAAPRALHRECARHGVRISYAGMGRELEVLAGFALPAALSGVLGGLATRSRRRCSSARTGDSASWPPSTPPTRYGSSCSSCRRW